jgi:SAM-dependent methyltransferase
MNVRNGENSHDDVYGQTFALYTDDELDEFSRFFERWFRADHIDPQVLFNGRAVLDAGCGNGRGALFAARHGALEVSAVDVSQTNIETTQRHLWKAGARIGTLQAGTLERLQFESESFDVVWCNGVLMHTAEPDTCLKEITRVLKIGGNAWMYVYGAGGIYWRFIRQFREMTQGIPAGRCISILQKKRLQHSFYCGIPRRLEGRLPAHLHREGFHATVDRAWLR